jgi:hypothetical protein
MYACGPVARDQAVLAAADHNEFHKQKSHALPHGFFVIAVHYRRW